MDAVADDYDMCVTVATEIPLVAVFIEAMTTVTNLPLIWGRWVSTGSWSSVPEQLHAAHLPPPLYLAPPPPLLPMVPPVGLASGHSISAGATFCGCCSLPCMVVVVRSLGWLGA